LPTLYLVLTPLRGTFSVIWKATREQKPYWHVPSNQNLQIKEGGQEAVKENAV